MAPSYTYTVSEDCRVVLAKYAEAKNPDPTSTVYPHMPTDREVVTEAPGSAIPDGHAKAAGSDALRTVIENPKAVTLLSE